MVGLNIEVVAPDSSAVRRFSSLFEMKRDHRGVRAMPGSQWWQKSQGYQHWKTHPSSRRSGDEKANTQEQDGPYSVQLPHSWPNTPNRDNKTLKRLGVTHRAEM